MNEDKYVISEIVRNVIAPGNRAFLSPIIENAIDRSFILKYGENWQIRPKIAEKLANAYKKLCNNFDPDNYKEDVPYLYSAYYIPNNLHKIQLVLLKLFEIGKLQQSTWKILDVGPATGTSELGCIDFFEVLKNVCRLYEHPFDYKKIEFDYLEHSSDNIKLLHSNLRNYLQIVKESNFNFEDLYTINECKPITIGEKGWEKNLKRKKYDLIILSNVLNELKIQKNKDLICPLIDSLKDNGNLIIIEPADRNNTKNLHRFEVFLEDSIGLSKLSPCGKLSSNNNVCDDCWSFEKQNLNIPKIMKIVNEALKSSKGMTDKEWDEYENEKLKWSFGIFCKYDMKSELGENHKSEFTIQDCRSKKIGAQVDITAEIVSKKIGQKYVYKICDQTIPGWIEIDYIVEKDEKIPAALLPRHEFGDILKFKNIKITHIGKKLIGLKVDSETEVSNVSRPNSIKQKISFKNADVNNLRYFLKKFWNFNDFRDGQFAIIKNVLEGTDTLGILPTGAGKSLCFQMCCFLTPGTSLVISPLKSLMKDQIDNLKDRGFDYGYIDYLDSSRSSKQKDIILKRFRNGYLKILYISPERLLQENFQKELEVLLEHSLINYFVVDEAHCISEWGHDFRPAYLQLKAVCKKLNNPGIIALTATASLRVKRDIIKQLEIPVDNDIKGSGVVIPKSMDRPEISFQVIKIPRNQKQIIIKRFLTTREQDDIHLKYTLLNIFGKKDFRDFQGELSPNGNSMVVFTPYGPRGKRKGTNEDTINAPLSADFLKEETYKDKYLKQQYIAPPASFYSGIPDPEKIRIQEDFKRNKISVLFSTKGYGMGIDKPNIRCIIHYNLPQSLEGYYQEAGRAGRDTQHAHAVLIASKRYDTCVKNCNKIGEPPCILNNRFLNIQWKQWFCFYSEDGKTEANHDRKKRRGNNDKPCKCDYGRMAKFIENEYPHTNIIKRSIYEFWQALNQKYKESKNSILKERVPLEARLNKKESIILQRLYKIGLIYLNQEYKTEIKRIDFNNQKDFCRDLSTKWDKQLYYFKKYGLIKDYYITDYKDGFAYYKIYFEESVSKDDIEQVAIKIGEDIDGYKKQKYNMLQSMELYIDGRFSNDIQTESDWAICRRNILMAYFGDETWDRTKPCEFCDLDGISGERAKQYKIKERVKRIYEELDELFKLDNTIVKSVVSLIKKAQREEILNNIKIRSMRYLEDYPNNRNALYCSGYISIMQGDFTYGKNQISSILEYCISNKEYSEVNEILNNIKSISSSISEELLAEILLTKFDRLNPMLKEIDRFWDWEKQKNKGIIDGSKRIIKKA